MRGWRDLSQSDSLSQLLKRALCTNMQPKRASFWHSLLYVSNKARGKGDGLRESLQASPIMILIPMGNTPLLVRTVHLKVLNL